MKTIMNRCFNAQDQSYTFLHIYTIIIYTLNLHIKLFKTHTVTFLYNYSQPIFDTEGLCPLKLINKLHGVVCIII